jgi:hypothetical protein
MGKYCPECGTKLEDKDLHIVIVLDESGSMETVRDSTISAINEFLDGQRKEQGKTWVTLTKFDTEFRPLYEYTPIEKVKKLNKDTYTPTGMTALHDAIGKTINTLKNRKSDKQIKTLFVVMTDGMENSSKEFTLSSVKTLIDGRKEAGWDFMFLGANIDSYAVGGTYGFGTTVNFVQSKAGMRGMSSGLASYSHAYRTTGLSMDSLELQNIVNEETAKEEN